VILVFGNEAEKSVKEAKKLVKINLERGRG